jgi:hypothetical protein
MQLEGWLNLIKNLLADLHAGHHFLKWKIPFT